MDDKEKFLESLTKMSNAIYEKSKKSRKEEIEMLNNIAVFTQCNSFFALKEATLLNLKDTIIRFNINNIDDPEAEKKIYLFYKQINNLFEDFMKEMNIHE